MPLCKECHDIVMSVAREHCHTPTIDQVVEILWTCTCYPAGCGAQVERHVRQVFDGDCSNQLMRDVIAFAQARVDREIERAMEEWRSDEQRKE